MLAGLGVGALLLLIAAAIGGLYLVGSTVTVQTTPADATVLVDGREVGRTDANGSISLKRVRPGSHSLVVKKDGFVDWNQTFSVSFIPGQVGLTVPLELVVWKLTVVTIPAGASVSVTCSPAKGQQATLDPATKDRYSWKLFHYAWNGPTPGEHTLISRVTETSGNVQPTEQDLASKKSFLEHNAQAPRKVRVS